MENSDLQQLLESDCTQLDELSALLQSEKTLLEERALDKLNDLLQTKQLILATLENNDHIRRRLLQGAGVPAAQSSLPQLRAIVARSGTDSPLYQLLDSIESRLRQCRELSESNSIIVHRSRINAQRALSILRGPATIAGLYTSHGGTLGGNEPRDLGSA
jgi:flagellar biosynthesis protein FlgN